MYMAAVLALCSARSKASCGPVHAGWKNGWNLPLQTYQYRAKATLRVDATAFPACCASSWIRDLPYINLLLIPPLIPLRVIGTIVAINQDVGLMTCLDPRS